MKIQAVIGANYGDEGKGLVSGCLAREANRRGEKILTVFYNGTNQRAHTFEGEIHRAMAAGTKYGSDTFYHPKFVVDPISLWILQAKPIIDPNCRVIIPDDVMTNRRQERERGRGRHGSCGFGLFECVKRSRWAPNQLMIKDLKEPYRLYHALKQIRKDYYRDQDLDGDDLYNTDMFMKAIAYITKNCSIEPFEKVVSGYDTVIFEGGQGLMLDQRNGEDYPHLTPSSPGSNYFKDWVNESGCPIELFYVSRSYLTRHGAGPMDYECPKDDICADIVDQTNLPNEFQGDLRFGRIDTAKFRHFIRGDFGRFDAGKRKVNVVFTHMNYTDHKIETVYGRKDPDDLFLPNVDIYVSDQKDQMEKL